MTGSQLRMVLAKAASSARQTAWSRACFSSSRAVLARLANPEMQTIGSALSRPSSLSSTLPWRYFSVLRASSPTSVTRRVPSRLTPRVMLLMRPIWYWVFSSWAVRAR